MLLIANRNITPEISGVDTIYTQIFLLEMRAIKNVDGFLSSLHAANTQSVYCEGNQGHHKQTWQFSSAIFTSGRTRCWYIAIRQSFWSVMTCSSVCHRAAATADLHSAQQVTRDPPPPAHSVPYSWPVASFVNCETNEEHHVADMPTLTATLRPENTSLMHCMHPGRRRLRKACVLLLSVKALYNNRTNFIMKCNVAQFQEISKQPVKAKRIACIE